MESKLTIEYPFFFSIPIIRKRVHVFDLPSCILEKILREVVFEDRGIQDKTSPPYKLLPLAISCKTFRRVVGTFLTHDTMWEFKSEVSKIRNPQSCPQLSDNPNELQNVLIDFHHCRKATCTHAHRQIAWYKLALAGLKAFDFGRLCMNVPAREITFLVQRIGIIRPQLRDLKLEKLRLVHPSRLINVVPVVRTVICVASNCLESLNVDLSAFSASQVVDAICSHPLPKLKSLDLHISREGLSHEIVLAAKVLRHGLYSGAHIERIGFTASPPRFAILAQLAPLCPYVKVFQIDPAPPSGQTEGFYGRLTFPDAYFISDFKVEKLTINGIMSDQCLKNLFEAINEDNIVEELRFNLITLRQPLFHELLTLHRRSIGYRIRVLNVTTCLEPGLIDSISDFCPHMRELSIACREYALPAVEILLRELEHLEVFGLRCYAESTSENVQQFLEATEDCISPIRRLKLNDLGFEPWQICDVVNDFQDTLEEFELVFSDTSFVEYDLKFALEILQHLEELTGLDQFRELSLPFAPVPAPNVRTVDEEVLVRDIQATLEEMKQKFRHLDTTSLENWVNWSYMHEEEDSHLLYG